MRSATTTYVRCTGSGRKSAARAHSSVIAHAAKAAGRGVFDLRAEIPGQDVATARDRGVEDFGDRHRLAEREALPRLATEREQRVALLVELDAFGDGVEP